MSLEKSLTLTRQLNRPPQAALSIVELNGIFAHVFLCRLFDLKPKLLSHHTALYTVREGDGWISSQETTQETIQKGLWHEWSFIFQVYFIIILQGILLLYICLESSLVVPCHLE